MPQYAWLEFDEGKWHFLTDLYAWPAESTKWWPSRQLAIAELVTEGWRIVRAYPRGSGEEEGEDAVSGYGLTRCMQFN